ncbi:MAG: Gldg family protein, partial [Chloroflexota bacterium]
MSDTPQRPSRQSLIQQAFLARGALSAVIAIAGAVGVLVGVLLFLFPKELHGPAYTLLAVGGVMLLASLMMSFATVREAIIGRRGRYGANTAVMIIAFVALALLVQIIAVRNSYRWDITATRQFSLAPQTLGILNNLKDPIRATAFFVPGVAEQEQYRVPVQDLLSELKHRSGGKFSFRFVDPDLERSLAKQY